MATRADIELAKQLLQAGVVTEQRVREALAIQEKYGAQGKVVTMQRVLEARGDVPPGALVALTGPPVLDRQPLTNYRLLELLGEGGVGQVYSAIYEPNDTPVAVKLLDPVKALRDMHRERFYREAQFHIENEHPNIVAGYEVGFESGYHFYSMDLVEGVTVLEVIERRGHLENTEALSVTLQVARALEFLHERGLLHRDLKPGNVMVDADGWVRLIDLGLMADMRAQTETPLGEAATTVGTVEYLSPEQARGRTDLDARADLYSLGVTLYHMVVGEVPFHGESTYEVMAKQILSAMDGQKIKQRRIEPEVYYLIAKLAAKERDERLANAAEVIQVVEGYLPGGVVPLDLGEIPVAEPLAGPPSAAPSSVRPTRSSPEPKRAPRRSSRSGPPAGDDDDPPHRTRRWRHR